MKTACTSLISWIGLFLSLSLLGCASAPRVESSKPAQLFHDELFKPPAKALDPTAIFALSPAMEEYLAFDIARHSRNKGSRQGLLDALYNKSLLQLEYDDSMTRDAAQAFAERRGNCLSLVIMTGAFAKRLGLPVRYQSVYVEEVWSRTSDMYFLSGHVNLSLGRRMAESGFASVGNEMMTVDFMPPERGRLHYSREISEEAVMALFMNNRAAESLRDGQVDEAYWWARGALTVDPKQLLAYNTLAVIYRRKGQSALAEPALRHVLAAEPANVQAMSNLALVMGDLGRYQEAQTISQRLAELQPFPPYKYFNLGVEAMKAGEFAKARDLFGKEIERSAYFHEFHFWSAMANFGLGDLKAARQQMALALENSTTSKDRERYSAKLDLLKLQRKPFQ
jgi:Tfp pilus assembly protein PilF